MKKTMTEIDVLCVLRDVKLDWGWNDDARIIISDVEDRFREAFSGVPVTDRPIIVNKCQHCGSEPVFEKEVDYWRCSAKECNQFGPNNDRMAKGWNKQNPRRRRKK